MVKRPRNTPRLANRTRGKQSKQPTTRSPDVQRATAQEALSETLFLGQWIVRLRLVPQEVSIEAKIGKSYVSQLISGKKKNPSAIKMLRISRVMGVTVNDLYRPPPMREQVDHLRTYSPETIRSLIGAGN